jgi:hypothetical protein
MAVAARRRAALKVTPGATGVHPTEIAAVSAAANKHGIPFWTLWGVFGAESSWGKGGTNWFGLVSVPRTGSFAGDAEASASTLSRLYKEHGNSWEPALRAYSGNSYGEAHLKELVSPVSGHKGTDPGAQPQAGLFGILEGKVPGFAPQGKTERSLEKLTEQGPTGWVAELLAGAGKLVLTGVLLLAGAVLVIYGIMVAVRPRDRAFSIPTP